MSCVEAEPLAVFVGGVLGHADCWAFVTLHAVGHGVVWGSGSRDEVYIVFDLRAHEV